MEPSTERAASRRVARPPRLPDPGQQAAGPPAGAGQSAWPHSTEFLALKPGGEEHGIDILRVQRIRSVERPARIAHAPEHIFGVVDAVSDVIAMAPEQLRPVPELHPGIAGDHLLAIESLMSSPGMGLVNRIEH